MNKIRYAALIVVSSLAIVACGGGESDPTRQFSGAASVGDFASFTVNGQTLSYQVDGAVFGSQSGTVNLQPMFGTSLNTHFWDIQPGNGALFLGSNIAMAYFPSINSQSAVVVGLEQSGNLTSVVGKTFIYVDLPQNGPAVGCEVTINSDQTAVYNCLDGSSGTLCWQTDTANNRLKIGSTGNNCSTWSGSNPTYYLIARPAANARASFVLDHVDGSGIGVGTERRTYYDTDFSSPTTYEFLRITSSGACRYEVLVEDDSDPNNSLVNYSYDDTNMTGGCNDGYATGRLELNTYSDGSGSIVAYNGAIATVTGGLNIFLEPNGGYAIVLDPVTGSFDIGAVR
jgi:hypothetical protein